METAEFARSGTPAPPFQIFVRGWAYGSVLRIARGQVLDYGALASRRPFGGRMLLGRSQVVRQWILIPPCGGSNPPAPAKN